jgi:hypothetical protein
MGVFAVKKYLMTIFIFVSTSAHCWDGYDWQKSQFVEIDKGNLVRESEQIEVYKYGEGYKTYNVEAVDRYGSSVEVEVNDPNTGEKSTFEMESR